MPVPSKQEYVQIPLDANGSIEGHINWLREKAQLLFQAAPQEDCLKELLEDVHRLNDEYFVIFLNFPEWRDALSDVITKLQDYRIELETKEEIRWKCQNQDMVWSCDWCNCSDWPAETSCECSMARYCDKMCQEKHWQFHQKSCQSYRQQLADSQEFYSDGDTIGKQVFIKKKKPVTKLPSEQEQQNEQKQLLLFVSTWFNQTKDLEPEEETAEQPLTSMAIVNGDDKYIFTQVFVNKTRNFSAASKAEIRKYAAFQANNSTANYFGTVADSCTLTPPKVNESSSSLNEQHIATDIKSTPDKQDGGNTGAKSTPSGGTATGGGAADVNMVFKEYLPQGLTGSGEVVRPIAPIFKNFKNQESGATSNAFNQDAKDDKAGVNDNFYDISFVKASKIRHAATFLKHGIG